jgi:hypothetical protein
MDPAARYRHELRLAGTRNGPPKPIRGRRTDRQEIGWYGFAAQRGCTRIIKRAPPTSYRTKDPAHSIALRQQRNPAVRGASSVLEHPALLFRSGRTRGYISVSWTAGPRGFESSSLQRRVRCAKEDGDQVCIGFAAGGRRTRTAGPTARNPADYRHLSYIQRDFGGANRVGVSGTGSSNPSPSSGEPFRLNRPASTSGTRSSNPLSSSSESVLAVNRRPLPEEPRGFAALGACTGT